MRLTPTFEVLYYRISATTSDNPYDILIAIVDLLVLGIRRYQSKVTRGQLLPLFSIPSTHNGTVTFRGEHDGVLFPMVMNCRSCVRFRDHYSTTHLIRDIYKRRHANHAFCLGAIRSRYV